MPDDFGWDAIALGAAASVFVGFSKTGLPGAAIPAVAMMAEAFPDDTKLSVGAMLPVLILGDLFAIAYYHRHAQWKRLAELFPYVVLGMVPGYLVLWRVPSDGLRVLLGTIILVLLVMHAGRRRLGWDRAVEHGWFTAITGVLAGFGTTVGNAAGPVMSVFLVGKELGKREFLGTAAWFFFLVNVSKLPFFTLLGVITPTTLKYDALVAPALVVGAFLGARLIQRIPQVAFDTLVLGLAGAAAIRMVLW